MQSNRIVTIVLVVLLAIFLQVLFVFADNQDTPHRAAVEFATAYVRYDQATLKDRLCEENRVVDEVDVIDAYIHRQYQRAQDLGYSLNYMKDRLYHLRTHTVSADHTTATVRLTAERRSPLRSFFGGTSRHLDETLELVREDGRWRVCGGPFSLPEA